MKVTELKAALAERGLDTKGNKAALVERLQEAEDNVDNNVTRDTPVENNGNNGGDLYNPEEVEENEENGEAGENGNGAVGDNEASVNGEGENGAGFDHKEFVHSKPQGISFGLHEPKPVKPQPKEAPVQSEADHEAAAEAASRARQGAASFFAPGSESASGGGAPGAEAAVPLPPTTSFMEDSEDEEEEGPPGLGNVELPIALNKVRTLIASPSVLVMLGHLERKKLLKIFNKCSNRLVQLRISRKSRRLKRSIGVLMRPPPRLSPRPTGDLIATSRPPPCS